MWSESVHANTEQTGQEPVDNPQMSNQATESRCRLKPELSKAA